MTYRKGALFVMSLVVAAFTMLVLAADADAAKCLPNDTDYLAASPASNEYPRQTANRDTDGGCAPTNSAHVFLSSYFSNSIYNPATGVGGNPGSTLNTPNSSYHIFLVSDTAPSEAVAFNVNVISCIYGNIARDVYISDGLTLIETLVGSGLASVNLPATKFIDMSDTYGTVGNKRIYRYANPMTISVRIDSPRACPTNVFVSGGAIVTFAEDPEPTTVYGSDTNRYNQATFGIREGTPRRVIPNGSDVGAFALRTGATPSHGIEYILPFAPTCDIKSNTRIYLRVYDADAPSSRNPTGTTNGSWEAGYDNYPAMEIMEYASNGAFIRRIDPTGNANRVAIGNDEYGEYALDVQPGNKYVWRWWNVSAANGLQIWMPFSEISARPDAGCPANDPQYACEINSKDRIALPGSTQVVQVKIMNKSGASWPGTPAGATNDGDRNYSIGLVDTTKNYAKLQQPAVDQITDMGGSTGPPDYNNASWVDSEDDTNLEMYSFGASFNLDRFAILSEVSDGSSITFAFKVLSPATAGDSLNASVRILNNKGAVGTRWFTYDPNNDGGCDFKITAGTPPPVTISSVCTYATLLEEGDGYIPYITIRNESISTKNIFISGIRVTINGVLERTSPPTASGRVDIGEEKSFTMNGSPEPGDYKIIDPPVYVAATTGKIPVRYDFTYTPDDGTAGGTGYCDTHIIIANKPYFRAADGDIIARGIVVPDSNKKTGEVLGFNMGASDGRLGSATTTLIQSKNGVDGVASGMKYNSSAPVAGTLFTFSNTTGTGWGGNFGDPLWDEVLSFPTDGSPVGSSYTIDASENGKRMMTGGIEPYFINGGTIGQGNVLTIVVDGDLVIRGNIVRNNLTYNTLPSRLRVLVNGNLYISQDVSELYGEYVASDDVYTCHDGTFGTGINLDKRALYNKCKDATLLLNGSIRAGGSIFLTRMKGTLKQSAAEDGQEVSAGIYKNFGGGAAGGNNIAEMLQFLPEVYLTPPAEGGDTSGLKYQSLLQLPPLY